MNLQEILSPNPTIIEIGANVGSDTLLFSSMFPGGKIHAIEPDPNVFAKLVENTQGCSNVTRYNIAIGSHYGTADFYPSNQGLSGSLHKPVDHLRLYPEVKFSEPISVKVWSLDEFVSARSLGFIEFVWADVQGAEADMIFGGMNTFRDKVRFLKTEFSNQEIYEGSPTLKQILEYLPDYELSEILWVCPSEGDALLVNRRFK